MKPKVFIASPLFNKNQVTIIEQIESALTKNEFEFYSARLHSGSDKMTPDQRKDLRAWDPVYDSNVQGLEEARVMIAVLEYAMPEGQSLKLHFPQEECEDEMGRPYTEGKPPLQIELPDPGTVWEMGYHRGHQKLVLGFHSDAAKHLNLMLSHGVDGLLKGFDALEGFLAGASYGTPTRIRTKFTPRNPRYQQDAALFDWGFTEEFDAGNKEVE
jgi:nucleoside 2-deoxyribosyltransferase